MVPRPPAVRKARPSLPNSENELLALAADLLPPHALLRHTKVQLQEASADVKSLPPESRSGVRMKSVSASNAGVQDSLYLRAILTTQAPNGLVSMRSVRNDLILAGLVTEVSWDAAMVSLGLKEVDFDLHRNKSIPREFQLQEYDNLVLLFDKDVHQRKLATKARWGQYGHFYAAASSYITLMETEDASKSSNNEILDIDNSLLSSGDEVYKAASSSFEQSSDGDQDEVSLATAYEERVTSFVTALIAGLTSCHRSTCDLKCGMKPDRTRFRFGQHSFACNSDVDATVERARKDSARRPPILPEWSPSIATLRAWQPLLTAEFKAKAAGKNVTTVTHSAIVQVAFNLAARIYTMYSEKEMVYERQFSGKRYALALLVVGSEFVPLLAEYTSSWLQYVFNPDSLVIRQGMTSADCLKLIRLGTYNLANSNHEANIHILSTMLLAVLIKSYTHAALGASPHEVAARNSHPVSLPMRSSAGSSSTRPEDHMEARSGAQEELSHRVLRSSTQLRSTPSPDPAPAPAPKAPKPRGRKK